MMLLSLIRSGRWANLSLTGLLWLAVIGHALADSGEQGVKPPPCHPITITPGLLP